jgi:hypothetical protein
VGVGPGPGTGCCGGGEVGLALGGQKGGGSRHGSWNGAGEVVVGAGGGGGGVGGTVLVGVGTNVLVGAGISTLVRGTQV